MEELLSILKADWSWVLKNPIAIKAISQFGNVIVELADGSYWRVCPEDLSADKVADDLAGWEAISRSSDFCLDWQTDSWVAAACAKLGSPALDQCYGFKIWPALNHDYSAENMVIKKLAEWLAASGNIGNQIKDLPDGTQLRLVTNHAGQELS